MTTEAGLSVESLTCPICLDKIATYVLRECSHALCYVCIEGLHGHSENMKCPTCRTRITKAPILFQSLAYTMPENTSRRMKNLFESWFPEPVQIAQAREPVGGTQAMEPVGVAQAREPVYSLNYMQPDILQESAKKEYECYLYRNAIIEKWQYILNQINFQNSQGIQFDTISSISRVTVLHHDIVTNLISGTSWSFIPFERPVIIKDRFHLIEKHENVNMPIRHRRLIAVLTNNQVNMIRTLCNAVISQMNRIENSRFYDEIGIREGRDNTICIHSGLFGQLRDQEIVIGCRGVWQTRPNYGSNYGIRFHILNADNDLY